MDTSYHQAEGTGDLGQHQAPLLTGCMALAKLFHQLLTLSLFLCVCVCFFVLFFF